MQYRVLHPSHVLVDGHPVVYLSFYVIGREVDVPFGMAVAEEIPRGVHEGVHGVGLAFCRPAALRA